MDTLLRPTAGQDADEDRWLPAYGPVEAALGFVLFYVIVERATPRVVSVVTAAVPGADPELVRLGLAAVLWLVLGVSALEQLRRQLAALGFVSHDAVDPDPARPGPSVSRSLLYLAVVLVAGGLAGLTFETAVATVVSLVRIVGTLDPAGFPLGNVAITIVFFLAFAVATRALDRLVVGSLRAFLAQ